jgi:hypothetical protein
MRTNFGRFLGIEEQAAVDMFSIIMDKCVIAAANIKLEQQLSLFDLGERTAR